MRWNPLNSKPRPRPERGFFPPIGKLAAALSGQANVWYARANDHNADEALINAVYCQVQCLGCTDWRSDRISRDRKILFGKAWHARSCRPLRSIMRKCCKNAADQTSITYLIEPGALQGNAINVATA